jgi:DoxX-like family
MDNILVQYVLCLVVGAIFNFLGEVKENVAIKVALISLWIAIILGITMWVFYFAGVKNEGIKSILNSVMDLSRIFSHLLLGYLIIYICIALKFAKRTYDNAQVKKIVFFTLLGVSIVTGNSFIMSTVGKATQFGEMSKFFTASGYAVWFLYFIMSAESLGAIGVLLHFKLKIGPYAATGLMLIMLGAVYTHWHNKDPFSDSYAAVSQFITLSLMLALYYFEKQANREQPATPIYVV